MLYRGGHSLRATMRGQVDRGARWGVVLSVVLGLGAMVRYPGGTPLDPATAHYSLNRNFLSDLGMTIAYDGQSNRIGAALFVTSLLLLVASILIILAGLVSRFTSTAAARMCARAAGLVGLMTAAAFVAVAFTPENRLMALHVRATLLAFRLVPVAAALLAAAAWYDGGRQRRIAVMLTLLSAVLALYAAFLAGGPSVASPSGLQANVIAQKVVTVVTVGVFLFLSAGAPAREAVTDQRE